eukprot:TRINITY_DN245_c0_g2_i2.p1 TRINITY_DN245_c0_g2~~TRINITY_DN245_c0_g2_i2.p1  ORF type:complete len:166 (+),score=40.27 TRINITY_DN245_c0_g2_i2:113-610(+)
MPILQISYSGQNQATQTCLDNLDEVAQALERDTESILKFMALRLNISRYICKDQEGRYALRGSYDEDDIDDLLDEYIDAFVSCSVCVYPENDMLVDDGEVALSCRSCGNYEIVKVYPKMCNYFVNRLQQNGGRRGETDGMSKKELKKFLKQQKQREDAMRRNGNQ